MSKLIKKEETPKTTGVCKNHTEEKRKKGLCCKMCKKKPSSLDPKYWL